MSKKSEIHIVAGFLGAGKTTFLNTYLPLLDGKTVVIENEAGTVGVDGALLPEGYPVRELSAGCICCTLAPNLQKQLEEIESEFSPDQIVIESSGVGNLSDVVRHCNNFGFLPTVKIVMVDASEFEDYADGFGTFYMDQIDNANLVLLTHVSDIKNSVITRVAETIKRSNSGAEVLTSDWRELRSSELISLVDLAKDDLAKLAKEKGSGETEHHHHHDHDFKNNGFEQICFQDLKEWNENTCEDVLNMFKCGAFGEVYRAKGFVKSSLEEIKYFDYTPSYFNLTDFTCDAGQEVLRFVIIGKNLDQSKLEQLLLK